MTVFMQERNAEERMQDRIQVYPSVVLCFYMCWRKDDAARCIV